MKKFKNRFAFFLFAIAIQVATAQPTMTSAKKTPSKTDDTHSKNFKTYKKYYASVLSKENLLLDAGPTFTIEQTPSGPVVFHEYFFDTKTMILETFYADKTMAQKDGPMRVWSDEGVLTTEGQLKNDEATGLWKYFDPKTGKLTEQGAFQYDKRMGKWESFFPNGKTRTISEYVNDELNGDYAEFDTTGRQICTRRYERNRILLNVRQTDSTDQVLTFAEKMPQFGASKDALMKYIFSNLKYPADAKEKGIGGRAVVQFVVERDGSLSDIYLLKGICKSIRDEVIRVFSTMPKWTPGEQNGLPVQVRLTIPVQFSLQ